MTTANQYNEAVSDLRAVQKRNQELENRHVGQVMRIEELLEAIEDVNNAGVLKIRALEARNVKLEAVRKVGQELEDWLERNGPWGPGALGHMREPFANALAAAEENDAT